MDCCVIGIGTFGYCVAKSLMDSGNKVLAIDSDIAAIRSIKDVVTHSLCLKVFDEDSLTEAGLKEIEVVVIAIGDNFEDSIMLTALLKKKLKTQTVICRAINNQHKEILYLIGADHVVIPEEEAGKKLADKISIKYRNFNRLSPNYSLVNLKTSKKWVGKKISEIEELNDEKIIVLGIKINSEIKNINKNYILKQEDILLISGENENLEKLI